MGRKKKVEREVIGVPSVDILLPILKELDISPLEYCLCFVVDRLAHNAENKTGWCYASKEHLAGILNVTRVGITKTINRMIEQGLLQKQEGSGNLTITQKWTNILKDYSKTRREYYEQHKKNNR